MAAQPTIMGGISIEIFKKLFTNKYELQKLQDNISEVLTDFFFNTYY